MLRTVGEAELARRERQCFQHRIVRDPSEREDHARRLGHELRGEKPIAPTNFPGQRLILRRQTFHRVGNAAIVQLQSVVDIRRISVVREPEVAQRTVQQDARVVAGEGTSGTVSAVHARSETDNEELRRPIAEGRDRPRVVIRMAFAYGLEVLR